jgi:RHS repeat-associated protein
VQYFYDESGHLLGEYDATGAMLSEYIWLGQTPIAVVKPASVAAVFGLAIAGAVAFASIDSDYLESPRAVVNSSGIAIWRWDSSPYGEELANENPSGLGRFVFALRFAGQQFDELIGHYNQFRTYEPATGRFLESDPVGLQGGFNTYAYVDSNPLSFSDPAGLDKRGPKPGLAGPHNQTILEVANCIKGLNGEILSGGKQQGLKEKVLKIFGGFKKSRRPDLTYKLPGCSECAVNVGRSRKGAPVPREQDAMSDISSVMPVDFVPYDDEGAKADAMSKICKSGCGKGK